MSVRILSLLGGRGWQPHVRSGGLFLIVSEVQAGFFGDSGVVESMAAEFLALDFGACINETEFRWVEGQSPHFLCIAEADGVIHVRLEAFTALGLEFFELTEGFFHGPMEALFVDAEVDEGLGVVAEGAGGGHGGMDLGVWAIEIARRFEMTLGQHAVFDGTNAIDAP